MGHPRTFEAKACRGVKVAYDGDARDRRFRSKGHLSRYGSNTYEFVHCTRYMGSCGRAGPTAVTYQGVTRKPIAPSVPTAREDQVARSIPAQKECRCGE